MKAIGIKTLKLVGQGRYDDQLPQKIWLNFKKVEIIFNTYWNNDLLLIIMKRIIKK